VSILFRRLVPDAAFLRKRVAGRFFHQYFLLILSDGNPGVVPSGLLIMKTVAQIGDIKDLDAVATAIVNLVKGIRRIVLNVGKTS
jgi:hypothetical protein